ncbi:DUF4412 domain-containing protein [Salinisphaera sp. T31B1]|uniref:DUF4412 domain-containing protein n=1 Tax=Salinisphaera sp. T31B1 TaxID=727963 RepID=UPI00333FA1E3
MNRLLLSAAALLGGLITLTVAASPALAAGDDTTLVYQGAQGRFTVDIRPGEVRIDDASRQWQLYDESQQAIFSVDPTDQSYTRLDKSTARNIRAQVDALRSRVDAKVRQLPESQQATARAALLQSMPALDSSEHRVGLDKTGRTDTIAGVACNVVQVVRDGRPAESLCVASAESLGISGAGFDSVQSMFELMQTMLAGTGFQAAGLPYLSLSGMPVRFTDTNTGEQRQLISVDHKQLPDSRFTIPDTYIETAIAPPGS